MRQKYIQIHYDSNSYRLSLGDSHFCALNIFSIWISKKEITIFVLFDFYREIRMKID